MRGLAMKQSGITGLTRLIASELATMVDDAAPADTVMARHCASPILTDGTSDRHTPRIRLWETTINHGFSKMGRGLNQVARWVGDTRGVGRGGRISVCTQTKQEPISEVIPGVPVEKRHSHR